MAHRSSSSSIKVESPAPTQVQQICHAWHYDLLEHELETFRQQGILTDIVIIAGDEKIHAHKLLLAVYSPQIRHTVLSGNSVLDLSDVNPEIVSSLLTFIYKGEVEVKAEDLDELLALGARLEVQGLTGASIVKDDIIPKRKTPKRKRTSTTSQSIPDKKQKPIPKGEVEIFAEKKDEEYFKSEDGKHFVCAYCLAGFGTKGGVTFHVLLHTDSAPLFQCRKCDYETRHKCHLKTHYMKKHSVDGKIFETIWKKQYQNQDGPSTSTSVPKTGNGNKKSSFAKRIKSEPEDVDSGPER